MKKIVFGLILLTSAAFAQTAFLSPEEEAEWKLHHEGFDNGIIIIEENDSKSELEIKAEKVLNLMLDRIIAILEKEEE